MINLAQVQEAFAQGNNYEITHPVKGDDNYYIIFTSGTTGVSKGVQISHDNLLSFTNWMITDKEFATPSRPQMLAQPPYSLTCLSCIGHRPWHLVVRFSLFLQSSLRTLSNSLRLSFIANRYLDINTILCRYGHVVWILQQWENAWNHAFLLWWWRIDGQNSSKNCASVSQMPVSSMLTAQQKRQ